MDRKGIRQQTLAQQWREWWEILRFNFTPICVYVCVWGGGQGRQKRCCLLRSILHLCFLNGSFNVMSLKKKKKQHLWGALTQFRQSQGRRGGGWDPPTASADPVVSISLTPKRPGYPCLEICASLPKPPPPCLGANQQHNSVSEKHQSGVVSQISWHPWLTTPDWCALCVWVCVGSCVIVFVCVCDFF